MPRQPSDFAVSRPQMGVLSQRLADAPVLEEFDALQVSTALYPKPL